MHHSNKDLSDSYWQQSAASFDRHYKTGLFTRAFLFRRMQLLRRMLVLGSQDVLADVGCGSGIQAVTLSPFVKRIVGFDYSEDMIRMAQGHAARSEVANVSFKVCDAYALDAPTASFDCAISMGLLDYLEKPDQGLLELTRIVKPGGQIVFTVPKRPSLFSWLRTGPGLWLRQQVLDLPPIVAIVSRAELHEMVAMAGLKVQDCHSIWTTMWIVSAVKS